MSTEIKSVSTDRALRVSGGRREVNVRINTPGEYRSAVTVPIADLLAAIEAEGIGRLVPAEAIVIERSDDSMGPRVAAQVIGTALGFSPTNLPLIDADLLDRAKAHATHIIQAAEYLTANLPEDEWDEADVEALVDVIRANNINTLAWRDLARALLASGRVTVTR